METLVLSQSYEPVARIPWQRAIHLLFQGKVEVVEEYEDRVVRSVTVELRMPSVIRFVRALWKGPRGIRFSRENVYQRDHCRCQYCGLKVTRPEATYDHVVPRAQGGHTSWENIVIACVPCNQRKGNRTPAQARLTLLAVPVKPKKMPNAVHLSFLVEQGVPMSWRKFLRDVAYWHTELET
ncbi:HNH endonuclease [Corallococcus terminator]|uniref:HNH endonuclease n=1 Tax=Corallococcus terminator TaxID=2316733 RepID=A0A3A8IUV1_9BACT|nr:HNH endonuclease [Corallococcus terminator]RKG87132.1 HNH endonuclease [Corallococcus terminator]